MSLREGDRVLVPDREHAYLPATVVQRTEAGLDVRLADGSTHTLAAAASQVVLADPLALQGSDDMVRFNLLTEASIVAKRIRVCERLYQRSCLGIVSFNLEIAGKRNLM